MSAVIEPHFIIYAEIQLIRVLAEIFVQPAEFSKKNIALEVYFGFTYDH